MPEYVDFSPAAIRHIYQFIQQRLRPPGPRASSSSSVPVVVASAAAASGPSLPAAAAAAADRDPPTEIVFGGIKFGGGGAGKKEKEKESSAAAACSDFCLLVNKLTPEKKESILPKMHALLNTAGLADTDKEKMHSSVASAIAQTNDPVRHALFRDLVPWTALFANCRRAYLSPFLDRVLRDPEFVALDWSDLDAIDPVTRAAKRFQNCLQFLLSSSSSSSSAAAAAEADMDAFVESELCHPLMRLCDEQISGPEDPNNARATHLGQCLRTVVAAVVAAGHSSFRLSALSSAAGEVLARHAKENNARLSREAAAVLGLLRDSNSNSTRKSASATSHAAPKKESTVVFRSRIVTRSEPCSPSTTKHATRKGK